MTAGVLYFSGAYKVKKLSITFLVIFLLVQAIYSQSFEKKSETVVNVPSMVGIDGTVHSGQGFTILSPIAGRWANKQALVLDVPENCDVFYSFSGSHPMESGFAYDEPVLLEAQGNVLLKIALVFPHGNAIVYSVNYSVESPKSIGKANFELDLSQPLVNYSIGQGIKIPTGCSYRLGESQVFLPGEQILSLSGSTFPRRYLPCEVTDGENSWRFIISPDGKIVNDTGIPPHQLESTDEQLAFQKKSTTTQNITKGGTVSGIGGTEIPYEFYFAPDSPIREVPQEVIPKKVESPAKVDKLKEPPFYLSDWNIINFTNSKLLYAIDDGYWQGVSASVIIDRSKGHTIYWQSMDYEQGNPIYSFYLPPRPRQKLEFKGKDSISFDLGSDFTLKPTGSDLKPLSSLSIDAFYGEELRTQFAIDIYYKGLYQGREEVSVFIDKCPPAPPRIMPSSELFYNREDVQVTLQNTEEGKLFYAVDLLASEKAGFREYVLNTEGAVISSQENFQGYEGTPIVLQSNNNQAELFLVQAFAQDEYGNVSSIVEYKTLVDPINYYVEAPKMVEPSSDSAIHPDGSLARPFTSLQEALRKTEDLGFTRIHIKGILPLDEVIAIPSNCEILGDGVASGISFISQGGIVILKGQVTIQNCILELQDDEISSKDHKSILSAVDGTLSLVNCEVLGDYRSNGTLISSVDSSLSIFDSNITMRAGRYGAMISALRSSLSVTGGKFTVLAPTAVLFSLLEGELKLSDSNCKVFGQLGRVAELTGVKFSLVNNSFHGVFENISASTAQLVPVWQDRNSKSIENTGNEIYGFPGS